MLKSGDQAPLDIKVKSQEGDVTLKTLLGSYVVLYFYPKDDTPGCTTQACSFRDNIDELTELGAKVIGVSKDPLKSHDKFADKHGLNFPLWSDEDHKLMEAFGTWQQKSMFGKKYMSTTRSTFLIDPKGEIVHVWEKAKPAGHAKEVAKVLKQL